jgi:hypothetical protein
MTKVRPYHTDETEYAPEHRSVYHEYDDCKDGQRLQLEHRVHGGAGKPLCKECMRLGGPLPTPL